MTNERGESADFRFLIYFTGQKRSTLMGVSFYWFQIDVKMESWLVDVKRVRIPRPKFGGSSRCYPAEPPKDYIYEDRPEELKLKAGTNLVKATEDLRRALQEKL